MPNQMIDLISPWNLLTKWNQFNKKHVVLPGLLNHPPALSNPGNTNNAKRWDGTRVKNGQQSWPSIHYSIHKTTISHASQRPKHHTIYHIPIDMPCLLTRIDGLFRCKSK